MAVTQRIDLTAFFAKFSAAPAAAITPPPSPPSTTPSTPPATNADHMKYWSTIPGNKMQSLPDGSHVLRADLMADNQLPPEVRELKNTAKSTLNTPPPPASPVVANSATPPPGQPVSQPHTTQNTPPLASPQATQPGTHGQPSPAQQPPTAQPAAYNHEQTLAALQNPQTTPEERHAHGQAFAQHLVATGAVKPEDIAKARDMAAGNFTPESEAWLNQASGRFKQEMATQHPSLLSSPQGYGKLVGMWDALGPMGQLAFGVGVPAAMIHLLGGGGLMSLLGGLGIAAAGLGAAGTGMLGDAAQAEAGRFMGNMGNFLGYIPNEARNANIFDENSPKAKALEARIKETYLKEGPEAAQKLIDAQTAQFAPLERLHQIHPGLAYGHLMGMENGPKTQAEAEALYRQVSQRVNDARQPDFLANKARQAVIDQVTGSANNAVNAVRGWFGNVQ